jgi:probable rRNA maturation factor
MPLAQFDLAKLETTARVPRILVRLGVSLALKEISEKVHLSLVFVNDAHITKLHADFLGDPTPTDVMSFVMKSEAGGLEVEIYISTDTAARQARMAGVSLSNELLRLAVHGALHAIGYDDITPRKRRVMWKRQEEVVAAAECARSRTGRSLRHD